MRAIDERCIRAVALVLCAAAFLVPAGGCHRGGGGDDEPTEALVQGVSLSPEGFPADYDRIEEFYAEVAEMPRGGVLWNGAWRDDASGGSDSGEIPDAVGAVMQGAGAYGFTPMVVFGWRSGDTLLLNVPEDPTNDWTNASARALFLDMLRDFAAEHSPPYLFIGNENDMYYTANPTDYLNWVAFYESAYDSLKAAAPSTRVGTVFNFEHLSGQGKLNGWEVPAWGALESHDLRRIDVLAVTVYPWLHHVHASDVPDSYLEPLLERIGTKPLAITETGWPAENLDGLDPAWATSEQEQVDWVERLFSVLLAGLDVRLVNWLFLYPPVDVGMGTDWQLFASVSLRDFDGNARPVLESWLALQE
ncbi:MAG: hypothetical protein AB1486_03885 [Planctomycetota bacterium]